MAHLVYRTASGTDDSFTPRPGRDTEGPKRGLSTFDTAAAAPKGRRHVIDLDRLPPGLKGIRDENGHVSIVPVTEAGMVDDVRLCEWAACRGTGRRHDFTEAVLRARIAVEDPT
jgi:hypothetical protein